MGGFTELMSSFLVQTLSGVIEVFIGVWLALVLDRRRRAEDAQSQDDEQMREFDRAIDTILGSVVKNTAEAKRILRTLGQQKSPGLIHSGLESSVWYAVQGKFIALCRNVDERIIFSQFFDDVRRLQAFLDFRSSLLVSTTTAKLDHADPELMALEAGVDKQLATLAEDLRFCGVLLITDHGKPVHKRLMGIKTVAGSAVASQPA
jgi:hypothetical protein